MNRGGGAAVEEQRFKAESGGLATGSKGGAGRRALGLIRGRLASANGPCGPALGSAGLGGRGREGGGMGDDMAAAGSTGAVAR